MTEREELTRELEHMALYLCQENLSRDAFMQQFANRAVIILDKYEVGKRSTELVPYSESGNEKIIKQFAVAKTVSGRSERTIKYYLGTIRQFLTIVPKDLDKVTAEDVRYYLAKRKLGNTCTDVTLNNERRNLSAFFDWASMAEYVPKNPVKQVDIIKCPKKKKEAFSDMELEKIRFSCRSKMEQAMVEFLLSTGCRVTEMSEVKISDIDDAKLTVHGKGNKYRKVYLNAKAEFAIQHYLAERSDSNPYLFPGAKSIADWPGELRKLAKEEIICWYRYPELILEKKHMDMGTIESKIRDIGKRAGVEKCHPHRFRRTCATMALRKGMPIELVSKMLGHENIATTQIYLDLEEADLEHSHQRYVT
jgi:site-specific recombinase XerD